MRTIAIAVTLLTVTPAAAVNVLTNPGFEIGGGATSITGGAATAGPSAAAGWTAYNNSFATTTTALVPSVDPLTPGGAYMLAIDTTSTVGGGAGNGVYQFPTLFNFASVDVFVTSGVFQLLVTNDYGAHADQAVSTTTGQWQRLSVAFANANEIVLYSSGGPANFFVDNAYAGDVPNPAPLGTVPEPTTWALLIAGFGLTGAAMRRRKSPLQGAF